MTDSPAEVLKTAEGRDGSSGGRYAASFWLVIIAGGMFFLGLLPWLGLPGAHVCDDLVLIPPAIDLAEGRPMSNHHLREVCEALKMDVERWSGQSPVFQQMLGGWLKLAGVSNLSMLMFQAATNLLIFFGMVAVMRRFGVHPVWSLPPAVVLFTSEIRWWGMRWEAPGMMLLLLGVAFLLRRNVLGAFLSGACLVGAGAVLQQAGIYAGLFFLVGIAEIALSREAPGRRIQRASAMGAGALIPVGCFMWGIGWDLPTFVRNYLFTLVGAAGVSDTRASLLGGYMNYALLGLEWTQFAVILLLLGVVMVGMIRASDRFHQGLLAALVAGLVANILIVRAQPYRLGFIYVLVAFAAFCILGGWKLRAPIRRQGLAWLCAFGAIVLTLPGLCGYFLRLPDNAEAVRNALHGRPERAVYMDSFAAWDVFGWRLPAATQSLQNLRMYFYTPNHDPSIAPRAGQLFVIQESEYQQVPLRIFGRTFRSVTLNARRWDVVDYRGNSILSGKPVGLPADLNPRKP